MELNEKGSSLIQVLLVILVFTVLGLALMGNVIGENKRTNKTESNMQARYLAESGLTYFEKDFKSFVTEESRNTTPVYLNELNEFNKYIADNFLLKYQVTDGFVVGDPWSESNPEGIIVKAEFIDKDENFIPNNQISAFDPNEIKIKVTSSGKVGNDEPEILVGYYKPGVNIDDYTAEIADFEADGKAIDFSEIKAVGVDLNSEKLAGIITKPVFNTVNSIIGNLGLSENYLLDLNVSLLEKDLLKAGLLLNLGDVVNADVLDVPGDENSFYRVPSDNVVGVNALGPVLNLEIPDVFSDPNDGNVFETMETERVIATRKGEVANIDVLQNSKGALLNADVLDLPVKNEDLINVKIDGYNSFLTVAGAPLINNYSDIDFKKLAVMGNVVIQQDRYGPIQDIDKNILDNEKRLEAIDRLEGLLAALQSGNLLSILTTVLTDLTDILSDLSLTASIGIKDSLYYLTHIGELKNLIQNLINDLSFHYNPFENQRRFSFDEGLFVYKTLIIGGKPSQSGNNLILRGDMVAKQDLIISDVNLQFGDSNENENDTENPLTNEDRISDFHVHKDATIKKTACINFKDKTKYGMRIFAKGTVTIENNSSCGSTYDGVFYARKAINIVTPIDKPVTINGALIGKIMINGEPLNDSNKHLLIYNKNASYPYLNSIQLNKTELTNLGRKFN